jgi:divalent anion:Na+ symporter, DASS family
MLINKESRSLKTLASQLSENVFRRRVTAFILPISLGMITWFLPPPVGVSLQAWHLLAIFLATIVGFVLKPLPQGSVTVIALVVALITNTLTIEEGLSGFGDATSWLTCSSFILARAIIKTGLARRIAYSFMRMLGKNTLFLSYGLVATDFILSPAMPSGCARAAGVIFPLVKSLSTAYESESYDGTERRIGSYLMTIGYQATQITTAMFLTAMVANPLMAKLAGGFGVDLDWGTWALAAIVPGVISLIAMPLIIYYCYPPEIKVTPEAPRLAKKELVAMGKMTPQEWLMLATTILLLFLWCFGKQLGELSGTTTALLGIALLLLTGVLTWKDVAEDSATWNMFVWFSILLMMANYLDKLGFIPWLSQELGNVVNDLSWQWAFLFLGIAYFYANYFFASKAARAGAMYPAFLAVAVSVGAPPMYAALSLAFLVNLSGCLCHYATSEAPVYYGAGYIDAPTWLRLGAILSIAYMFIWLVIGGFWWQILGLL